MNRLCLVLMLMCTTANPLNAEGGSALEKLRAALTLADFGQQVSQPGPIVAGLEMLRHLQPSGAHLNTFFQDYRSEALFLARNDANLRIRVDAISNGRNSADPSLWIVGLESEGPDMFGDLRITWLPPVPQEGVFAASNLNCRPNAEPFQWRCIGVSAQEVLQALRSRKQKDLTYLLAIDQDRPK